MEVVTYSVMAVALGTTGLAAGSHAVKAAGCTKDRRAPEKTPRRVLPDEAARVAALRAVLEEAKEGLGEDVEMYERLQRQMRELVDGEALPAGQEAAHAGVRHRGLQLAAPAEPPLDEAELKQLRLENEELKIDNHQLHANQDAYEHNQRVLQEDLHAALAHVEQLTRGAATATSTEVSALKEQLMAAQNKISQLELQLASASSSEAGKLSALARERDALAGQLSAVQADAQGRLADLAAGVQQAEARAKRAESTASALRDERDQALKLTEGFRANWEAAKREIDRLKSASPPVSPSLSSNAKERVGSPQGLPPDSSRYPRPLGTTSPGPTSGTMPGPSSTSARMQGGQALVGVPSAGRLGPSISAPVRAKYP